MMNMNAVSMFGKGLDWGSGLTFTLTIVGMVVMLIVITILVIRLIKMMRKAPEAEAKREAAVAAEGPVVGPDRVIVIQHLPETHSASQEAPAVLEEDADEFVEAGAEGNQTVTYNRSFLAKYIQSSDDTKDFYAQIKNTLLSYEGVASRGSWKQEMFTWEQEPVARFVFRGKTLCVLLPLDPAQLKDSKYRVEDVSEVALYADTPSMYRVQNKRRAKLAEELIGMVAARLHIGKTKKVDEDYYLPYEGLGALIEKGLVKRIVRHKTNDYIN